MALGQEHRGLHLREAAKTSEPAAGGNHAMVRQAWFVGSPHDLSYCAGGAGTPRQARHITVRDYPARRNPSQDMKHSSGEHGGLTADDHNVTIF